MKKIQLFLLSIITLLAFLLRVRFFLSGDFYFLIDQARDLMLVKQIIFEHPLTLIGARTGLGGLFHGPLWLYMITPFFELFKGNPFLSLVPLFLILSLSVVILGFYIGWKLNGVYMGLLLALVLSVSSSLISDIIYTSNAHVEPIIVLLYLFTTIQFLRGKDKHLIFSLFLIGLGFQFESAFAVLLIPLTIFIILLKHKLPRLKILFISIVAFLTPLSTFILFDLRHQFLMTKAFLRLFSSPIKPLPGYEQYSNIVFRFFDRINALQDAFLSLLPNRNILAIIFLLIVVLSGLFIVAKRVFKNRKLTIFDKEYFFIMLSPIIIFGLYIFYPLPLWPHYLLPITIFMAFILIYSVKVIYKYKFFKVITLIFILFLLIPVLQLLNFQYILGKSAIINSDGSYKNQLNVSNWVLNDAGKNRVGYFVYSPGILTYNMDYLLWWLSVKEDKLTPVNQKLRTTYLILYPHLANDNNAYNFWKKNVIRTDGRVILTKKFNGGILVEKLLIQTNEQPIDSNYFQNLIFR